MGGFEGYSMCSLKLLLIYRVLNFLVNKQSLKSWNINMLE